MSRYKRRQSRKPRQSREAANITAESSEGAASRRKSQEFNPDYSYVKKDLRRIGILASFFLGVLVILSFILN
jgi:hypothetical protein